MGEPPVVGEATQVTGTWVFWYETTETEVGTPGVPTIRELDGADGRPEPAPFTADTVKV